MKSSFQKLYMVLLIALGLCLVFSGVYTNVSKAENMDLNNGQFLTKIKNFGKKLTNKVPEVYTKEQAIKNGDIPSNSHLRTKKQEKRVKQFVHNVKTGKPDFIRFFVFTDLGDAIIKEYQFNGKLIYYRFDTSRDRSGKFIRTGNGKFLTGEEDYCTNLKMGKNASYITNCYYGIRHEFQ